LNAVLSVEKGKKGGEKDCLKEKGRRVVPLTFSTAGRGVPCADGEAAVVSSVLLQKKRRGTVPSLQYLGERKRGGSFSSCQGKKKSLFTFSSRKGDGERAVHAKSGENVKLREGRVERPWFAPPRHGKRINLLVSRKKGGRTTGREPSFLPGF